MEAYYLLKTEPTEYSFADLQKDGETEWDGVSNPVAVRHLSEMKPGSRRPGFAEAIHCHCAPSP